VTVPVVSALSVAVTAATAPTVVIVQTEVFALLAVVAPLLVASVELLPERMTVASATMTAVTVIGQGALLTATARWRMSAIVRMTVATVTVSIAMIGASVTARLNRLVSPARVSQPNPLITNRSD
jgi:hypothetical protein